MELGTALLLMWIGALTIVMTVLGSRKLSDRGIGAALVAGIAVLNAGFFWIAPWAFIQTPDPAIRMFSHLRGYALGYELYRTDTGGTPPMAQWETAMTPFIKRKPDSPARIGINGHFNEASFSQFLFAPAKSRSENAVIKTEADWARVYGQVIAVDAKGKTLRGAMGNPKAPVPEPFWKPGHKVRSKDVRHEAAPLPHWVVPARGGGGANMLVFLFLCGQLVVDSERRKLWGAGLGLFLLCAMLILTLVPPVSIQ